MPESWYKKKAADLSHEELKAYSRAALHYEATMFLWATARLRGPGGMSREENNAVVEAVYIHGRCLFHFLKPPSWDECKGQPTNPDSVHACHYIEDWKLSSEVSRRRSRAQKFVDRGNAWVAHLTTRRLVDDPAKAMEWPGVQQLWEEFRRFALAAGGCLHDEVKALAARTVLEDEGTETPRSSGGLATTNTNTADIGVTQNSDLEAQ